MRILFLSNEFSTLGMACLDRLCRAPGHEILVGIGKTASSRARVGRYWRGYGVRAIVRAAVNVGGALIGGRTLKAQARRRRLRWIIVDDVNDEETLSKCRTFEPDLGVACSFSQILRRPLLETPGRGMINVHPSLLPKYRGPYPYYWILQNQETSSGVTVHFMDEAVDSGDIIVQEEFAVPKGCGEEWLKARTRDIAPRLLAEVIEMFQGGQVPRRAQREEDASYFSFPQSGSGSSG